jgi:branched-chain amino acid aminotransferase
MQPVVAVRNGELISPGEAILPAWDSGLTLGEGLFETMRWSAGRVALMARHWQRMADAAAKLQIAMPDPQKWAAATRLGVQHAGDRANCWRIKWLLTRAGTWLVLCFELADPPASMTLVAIDFPLPARRQPLMKTLSYADNLQAKQMALDAGADECMRLDHQGNVAEGAMVNLFAVLSNRVVTADSMGILPGVARSVVLDLCESQSLPLLQTRLSLAAFLSASEWFATNALIGVCPVISIDGLARPLGPVTLKLRDAYWQFTETAALGKS